jgi:hypothetical protein
MPPWITMSEGQWHMSQTALSQEYMGQLPIPFHEHCSWDMLGMRIWPTHKHPHPRTQNCPSEKLWDFWNDHGAHGATQSTCGFIQVMRLLPQFRACRPNLLTWPPAALLGSCQVGPLLKLPISHQWTPGLDLSLQFITFFMWLVVKKRANFLSLQQDGPRWI